MAVGFRAEGDGEGRGMVRGGDWRLWGLRGLRVRVEGYGFVVVWGFGAWEFEGLLHACGGFSGFWLLNRL